MMKKYLDVQYKKIDDINLFLDLYMPDNAENPPLIMWIHGGAWMCGDRKSPIILWQVERGYAVASIDYRLTSQGIFPNHIIDCKDALLYLKQSANMYGYDAQKIAAAGDSAGGHLAALMGTSNGHADWESSDEDYSVQAVVDYYGPTKLDGEWLHDVQPDSPESLMLGEFILTPRGRARAAVANPITYIDGSEPPFLIIHGDKDDVVPYKQSIYLRDALEAAGVSVAFHRVHGGDHGFEKPEVNAVIDTFLDYHLK